MKKPNLRCLVVLAALAAPVSPAVAQDALGDGRALDANPQKGSGGRNPAGRDLAREVQFRNAIVTGNAPGGLSFREDVGYTSAEGFRDALGSDDLFAFRRDSLYSGLAGMGIRGTDALQYQFGLTTGARLPEGLRGSLQVERGFSRPAAGEPATIFTHREEGDERGYLLWSLRAPSSIVATRGMQPAVISTGYRNEEEDYALTASPLRGLHLDRMKYLRGEVGRPSNQALPESPTTALAPARPGEMKSPYESLMERLEEAAGRDVGADGPAWEVQLRELREQILAEEREQEVTAEVAQVLREGGTVTSLTPELPAVGPKDFDAYGEHMRYGQEHLVKGRYFDAEERFTRALAARPDDVMASIARVHAQVGAGMFLSGSLNLRSLLQLHPEVVGVRYGDQAMPSPERLRRLIGVLRAGLAKENGLPADAGLVLAYLGYQVGDADAVIEGLGHLGKGVEPGGTPAAFVSLLRKVWLAGEAPSDAGK